MTEPVVVSGGVVGDHCCLCSLGEACRRGWASQRERGRESFVETRGCWSEVAGGGSGLTFGEAELDCRLRSELGC